uniref:Uncharacterized protein n=1 Tax=Anopheles epiroticus TaxID=199890 RepID=A0A182PVW0_9DIPT
MVPIVIVLGVLLCTFGVESAPMHERRQDDASLDVVPLKHRHVDSSFKSTEEALPYHRSKREIIFRPLFVYRHQQLRRQQHRTTPIPWTEDYYDYYAPTNGYKLDGSVLQAHSLTRGDGVLSPSFEEVLAQSRSKRAIIFRPLFVYRQQQIKKQQIRNPPRPTTAG